MFSLDLLTGPFKDWKRDLDRTTDKTTMYVLRAVGRNIAAAARPSAPVYPGPLNKSTSTDYRALAEAGNLKKSIANAKKLNRVGTGDYSLFVGPLSNSKKGTEVVRHGTRNGHAIDSRTAKHLKIAGPKLGSESSKGQLRGVQMYRAKVNRQYGFMSAGLANSRMTETYEKAMARATEKYR